MNRTSDDRRLRIGELASDLNINPKTIRYYEEIGLLPPPSRTASGYRLYTATDRERLRFILKAKTIGLTLEEIAEIVSIHQDGEQPCEHVLLLLDRKVAAVDAQLRVLAAFRHELVSLRDAAANGTSGEARFCRIIEKHESRSDDLPPVASGK